VLVRRHSTKTSLPSVRSRALDKEYFKLKKIFVECQIVGTRQRSKIYNRRRRLVLLLYLSLTLHRSLSLTHRTPVPPPSPVAASPAPSPATELSYTRRRRLPHLSPPRSPSPAPSPAAASPETPPPARQDTARLPPSKHTPCVGPLPSGHAHVPGHAPRCRPTVACPHAPGTPPPAHRPPAAVRTATATRSPTRLPASQGDVNFSSFVSNCE
jgi:hypothetical protein